MIRAGAAPLRAGLFLIAALLVPITVRAASGNGNWDVTIAAWNLLNFGPRKAGLPPFDPLRGQLIGRMASIISRYDVVMLQELLGTGASVTQAIAADPQMANYNCSTVSLPSGRSGRQERYGICYATQRLILARTFDWSQQQLADSFTGPPQPPANVWMRPPLVATFTTIPQGDTPSFTFNVYVSHTKPAFSSGPPPKGTPANAAKNQSVFYELWGTQLNLAGNLSTVVLGDLNADCASYPARDRGQNFHGWTWHVDYGEKTNTAAGSNCAYDRLIFNDALQEKFLEYGIYSAGINVIVDEKRVSDHYLVWAKIGDQNAPKPDLQASNQVDVSTTSKALFPAGKTIFTNGTNLLSRAFNPPLLFICPYNSAQYFGGNQTYKLVDVRGKPTRVDINDEGRFTSNVVWNSPVPGSYKLVLDVDGDGNFTRAKGDIVNDADRIDFIVSDVSAMHSDVVTLGDNGQLRELFNEDVAVNVYAAARKLPPEVPVDVYVVSTALLPPTFTDWAAARLRGDLDLAAVSVPVNTLHGPIVPSRLTVPDRLQRLRTSEDGTLFTAVWRHPYVLYNLSVLVSRPPVPDYKAEYASDDECTDDLGDVDGCDSCLGAWTSKDANFQAVCNVRPSFSSFYGTSFNVVIDVNLNGHFDKGDLVDTHDIGDITVWLRDHGSLDSSANGNPAVGEYKEYLDAKLNLSRPLASGNVYDAETQLASQRYMCSPGVSKSRLAVLQQGSQVGFQLLDQEHYTNARTYGSGVVPYANAVLRDTAFADASAVCITGDDLVMSGMDSMRQSKATIQAGSTLTVAGNVAASHDSSICLLAGESLTLAAVAGGVTLVAPNPVTAAGAVILGFLGGAEAALCALGN